MEKDLVYLVWKNTNTRNKYKVAMLYKENGTHYFKYILENVKEAQKDEFELLKRSGAKLPTDNYEFVK